MPLRDARFPAARCLFQEINIAGVGVFSRYAIEGTTRAVETESVERNRCAARDTSNQRWNVQNSVPLAQTLSAIAILHASRPSGFTQQCRSRHGATLKDNPMAFQLELFIIHAGPPSFGATCLSTVLRRPGKNR